MNAIIINTDHETMDYCLVLLWCYKTSIVWYTNHCKDIITKNNLNILLLTFWLILIYVFYLQKHYDVYMYDQDIKTDVQVS